MDTFNIRPYQKQDLPAILELIKELALFEKAPEKVTNTVPLMEQEMDYFHCYVAESTDGEILGMALYYFVYYTWVGKSLYLDDIVVKSSRRGNGIGTQLLEAVLETGKKAACKRIRWQVLNWNQPALDFYKKYGCTFDEEWVNCDIE